VRITSINPVPLAIIPYLNAGRGPGDFYVDQLPVLHGLVDRLPEGLSAIVATADLQGRERFEEAGGGPPRLLGEVLPDRLMAEFLPSLKLPPGGIGVLLAGDFYTVPLLDRRGGTGDVTSVWRAFGDRFDWVVGVAGNHDSYGADLDALPRFKPPLHYLDNNRVNVADLSIAGLGGIVGNPLRPRRRSDDEFARRIDELLAARTDVLLMHDGPDAPQHGFRGSPIIRLAIERSPPTLLVRGHAHWDTPLVELPGGTQVLNVDARVVVLQVGQ
jgi:Icc protein